MGHIGALIFFGFLAAIILVPRYLKSRERQTMQETIRAAIERGQPMPSEMIDAMTRDAARRRSDGNDLRSGVIWLCIGLACAAFGYALGFEPGAEDARYPLMGLAAFPVFIGLGFLLVALFNRGDKR